MSTENVGDGIMSHQINDQIKDSLNEQFDEMSISDFIAWVETHRQTDEIAQSVYWGVDYLNRKWVKEMFDSYPDS